jgi:protein transport protein SEC24
VNSLVSVDLMSTPPDVASLYAPPPPLLLPHGVCLSTVLLIKSSLTNSDLSNCPPEYMQSTLGCVPQSNSLLKKTKIPFALTIRPYLSLRDDENPVPVVSDTVIARCRRCRTYINPFVTFIESGNRWRCTMCGLTNESIPSLCFLTVAPQAYDYDPQTRTNQDRMQRSELRYSVVEFVAPTEYMVRPPQPLVYLFLIDVSFPAITSGLVATATRTILESLDRIPNKDGRTKIGFIAVDSSLHYFSVSPNAPDAQMLVVGDIDDTFLPQPQDLLLNIKECREGIEGLLTRFSDMFQSNQNGSNAMGSALKAAHKLISPMGGKVVCLMASLPNILTGKLAPRDRAQVAGTSKESALLQAQNSFYKSFAVECSKHQVSVDMFLFSSSYQDVATLSCLPRYTGGQTFFYPGWSASRSEDAVKFANEFSKFLGMEIALEAVMRIRATSGKYLKTMLT